MREVCVSYIRWSSASQNDGDSLQRQRERIALYAANNNLRIVNEYRDEAISGTKGFKDRPALQQCLTDCVEDDIDVVLVDDPERLGFGRSLPTAELIAEAFRDQGIRIMSCATQEDLTDNQDPMAVMVRRIKAIIIEFDKQYKFILASAAKARMRARGEFTGGIPPFGSYPHERLALEHLKKLKRVRAVNGAKRCLKWKEIAEKMNNEGFKRRATTYNPHGGPWSALYCRTVWCRTMNRGTTLPKLLLPKWMRKLQNQEAAEDMLRQMVKDGLIQDEKGVAQW